MSIGRFLILFALTSAMGGMALALIAAEPRGPWALGVTALTGASALVGVLLLARVVVLTERARR